jgi:uncharacterized lipoprotein YbaY/heat shock protein HslJ
MLRYLKILTCFCLISLQANCSPRSTTTAVGPPSAQMFEVVGELTYRERIAVPPQSTAVVELRDVSVADAQSVVVTERIDLAGRQIPIPFRLTLDRAKLASGRRYSVRGAIISLVQQPLWSTTEAHFVDTTPEKAELGTLMMTRASAQGAGQSPTTQPGGPPGAPSGTLTATGNEPGWKLEIAGQQFTLLLNNGSTRVVAPRTSPETTGDTTKYVSTVDGRPLTATIVRRVCADSMSGMPHPNTVVVLFNGQGLRGCGGNPAELLQGAEWVVDQINGAPVVAGSRGTLNFAPDGSVSGKSFCNSYSGKYILTGETLSISPGISTLMACVQVSIMNQEKLFTTLLAVVRRFEIGAGGALILHTGDGRTIRARR